MLDQKTAVRLADQIVHYQRLILQELRNRGRVNGEKARVLANLRDYFMYSALRASRDEAEALVKSWEELEARADKAGDRFHAGFFFTLAQLLSLRYGISHLPSEKVTFEDWCRSFEETLRRLGLPGNPAWEDLAPPCPECGSLRTRVDPYENEAWCQNCLHRWGPISFWRM